MGSSQTLSKILLRFLLIALLILFYVPLAWTCVRAFLNEGSLSLYWFYELFADPSFFDSLRNSFLLAIASSFVSVLLSLAAVLRFPLASEKESKLSYSNNFRFYDHVMTVSLSLPEIILALSLLSYFSWAGLHLGFLSAWVAHVTLTLAFSYWILSVHFKNLDPALWEAAQDLGANNKTLLLQIVLPQMKPAIISSFWICFLISLDDFLISFFVTGSSFETLPLKLFSMIKVGLNPKVNALSFLILVVSSFILVGLYGVWGRRNLLKDNR